MWKIGNKGKTHRDNKKNRGKLILIIMKKNIMFFLKQNKILYKLAKFIQKTGADFLYLINLPVIFGLKLKKTFIIPRKNNIISVEKYINKINHPDYKIIKKASTIEIEEKESLNYFKSKKIKDNILFFPKTFILSLQNAHVISDGVVVTKDNRILSDFFNEMGPELVHHSIFTKWFLPKEKIINGQTALLIDKQNGFYFHWMFDVLPRLVMLENNNYNIDNYLFYQLDKPFQFETLNILGIDTRKIIQATKKSNFLVKNLIAPSLPGVSGIITMDSYKILREKMIPKNINRDNKYQKIYISRAKAKLRKILNEDELINFLKKFNFVSVNLEDYSLIDGIKIINSAQIIIAPHGAGLANMVFCNPKTKIVEIFSENYINTCYRKMSYICDTEYYYYIEHANKLENNDITINIEKFTTILKENNLL